MTEEWKKPKSFSSYEVSTNGNLRVRPTPDAGKRAGRVLNPTPDDHGRRYIILVDDTGKRRNMSVAALVLRTFGGPPPKGKDRAIHKNGICDDDRYSNLKWGTADDVVKEVRKRNPESYQGYQGFRLDDRTALRCSRREHKGESISKLAQEFKVSRDTMSNAIKRVRAARLQGAGA